MITAGEKLLGIIVVVVVLIIANWIIEGGDEE